MEVTVSKSELRMKALLDKILKGEPYFDNYRPDWLKNPNTGYNLELDRYYPSLKIGFEFNSDYHRLKHNPVQWERDKIKKKLCGKNGVVRLVVYYEELNEQALRDKIISVYEMRAAWANGKSYKKK